MSARFTECLPQLHEHLDVDTMSRDESSSLLPDRDDAVQYRTERDLLRTVIDHLPDHIFVKDDAGRYILDNISHRRFVGLDRARDVCGKTVDEFFPPDMARAYSTDDRRILESGKPLFDREEPIVDTDGQRRWVSTSKIPLRNAEGVIDRLVCISRDITGLKTARDALEEANRELEERVRQQTAELEAARSMQQSLTPRYEPDIAGIRIKGAYQPAREVGGDYLDYFRLDDGSWVAAMADVSGKGVPAALLASALRSTFRLHATSTRSASALLGAVNGSMLSSLDDRSFITAACILIAPDGNSMTYARAGHPPLLEVKAGGGGARLIETGGPAIGLIDDEQQFYATIQEKTIPLTPGARYILYTDGITEALGPEGDLFGSNRLIGTVHEHAACSAEQMVEAILGGVSHFTGDAPPRDDVTLLVMEKQ